jgi:RNA polymerase sigma-70 factor (ECF subfamily)
MKRKAQVNDCAYRHSSSHLGVPFGTVRFPGKGFEFSRLVENTGHALAINNGRAGALANGTMTRLAETETRTDFELLALSRNGDRDAFGRLVSKHYGNCLNLATFILRDRAEAEDEVQKACWKAFEHLHQYLGEAEFSTWLLRIVVNECRMLMRGRRRERFAYLDSDRTANGGRPMELPSLDADPEQDFIKREMLEVLHREIRCIPQFLRDVILLRDVEEIPMSDVAERLGITVSAAKSRLLRARGELRERVMLRCEPAKRMPPFMIRRALPARSAQRSTSEV